MYQVFLVNESASIDYWYEIRTFGGFSLDKQIPVSATPVPEADSSQTILVKLEGNTTTLGIDWVLLNEGSFVGTGISHNGTKWVITGALTNFTTVLDQVVLLDEYFSPKSILDQYSLRIYSSTVTDRAMMIKKGLVQSFNFKASSSSPVNWTASLGFIEGVTTVGANINSAEAPTISSIVKSPSSGTITGLTAVFKEYVNYVANNRPVTTGAQLIYKEVNSSGSIWGEINLTFAATTAPFQYTKTFTPLATGYPITLGKTYDVKIYIYTGTNIKSKISNTYSFTA